MPVDSAISTAKKQKSSLTRPKAKQAEAHSHPTTLLLDPKRPKLQAASAQQSNQHSGVMDQESEDSIETYRKPAVQILDSQSVPSLFGPIQMASGEKEDLRKLKGQIEGIFNSQAEKENE